MRNIFLIRMLWTRTCVCVCVYVSVCAIKPVRFPPHDVCYACAFIILYIMHIYIIYEQKQYTYKKLHGIPSADRVCECVFFFKKPFQVDTHTDTPHVLCFVSNVVLYLHWRREKRVKSTSVFTCGTAIAGATVRPAFVADFIFFSLLIGPEGSAATTTPFFLNYLFFIFLINRNSRSSSTRRPPRRHPVVNRHNRFIRLWKHGRRRRAWLPPLFCFLSSSHTAFGRARAVKVRSVFKRNVLFASEINEYACKKKKIIIIIK